MEVSSPALEWNGSDDYLLVHGSKSSSNERSHPEDPHVIPCMLSVEDDSSSKTPGWVNASSCDGDGGQVNQEHCKPNGEGGQNLHIFKNFG